MQRLGEFACVFGISGVGKTTLIERFIQQNAGWRALAASQLLVRAVHTEPDRLRTSSRGVIEANQRLLAEQIRGLRAHDAPMNWLLDAHSLIDNGAEFVPVPLSAIERLEPTALIFLFDDPAKILERRRTDFQRQRPLSTIERVADEQELAQVTALLYSDALKLALHRIAAGDLTGLAALLAQR